MEQKESHELEDDVYGGDVPGDAYMETDFEQSAENHAAADAKAEELESMKKRLQEIEGEAGALREMQAKVEKERGAAQDPAGVSAIQAEKEEVDSRSIYVGNVDYACKPEDLQHFQSCGTVNRVTISTVDLQRKYAKRQLDFPTHERETGGSSTAIPRRSQPRRWTQNGKIDEILAFMAHQEQVNLNFNEHFAYFESMMRTMLIHSGVDPRTIPPPPSFIAPFHFQYDYQQQGDASGVPPPENDEDEP